MKILLIQKYKKILFNENIVLDNNLRLNRTLIKWKALKDDITLEISEMIIQRDCCCEALTLNKNDFGISSKIASINRYKGIDEPN